MLSIVLVLVLASGVIELIIGNYFYDYAIKNDAKDFIPQGVSLDTENPNYEALNWYKNEVKKTLWTQESTDGLLLKSDYLENHSEKTVIIAHGYMGSRQDMGLYARMFYDLGYNVLLPDARGHGESEGDYVGFGWAERKDYQLWINQVIQKKGSDSKIILFGVSMGAATVMMTAGEKLPSQVKGVIEDCGYTTAKEELAYQQRQMFPKIPAIVSIPITSLVTKFRAGYFLGEADALQAVQKSRLPILFIHGTQDHFVPTSMGKRLYAAAKGNNSHNHLFLVSGAEHGEALKKDKSGYYQEVETFLFSIKL
ncbi:alpha/beta hydrolase [Enterococcus diestrammenae]|uniref:alpha/beta hydrolase n=1 Tax=Enterococcus diestrammenae TaxID=1155073 RepID=UPI001957417E